jgi:hypothetical protein
MRYLIIFFILFYCSDISSQIEFYNHNDCDRYTNRQWNSENIKLLDPPLINKTVRLKEYYNFTDLVNDSIVKQNIRSNILINDLIVLSDCFEKDCLCNFENLDTIFYVFSNKPAKQKILGYFRPSANITSFILLVQYPQDSTDSYEDKEMDSYLINLDSSYKAISTAHIGKFKKLNDGLSQSEINSTIKIKNNRIILKEETITFPLDIGFNLKKSGCSQNRTYEIVIKDNGRIEAR